MLSFSQHSLLKQHLKHSLGISREDMPQITQNNHGDFKSFLDSHKIEVKTKQLHPASIMPCQNELNTHKIENLMSNTLKTMKPIFISNDGYILDGHHTWAANLLNGTLMIVNEIGLPMNDLFNIVKEYDKVFNVGINQ